MDITNNAEYDQIAMVSNMVKTAICTPSNQVDRGFIKKSNDAMNGFVRKRLYDDSFVPKILPGIPITGDELTPSPDERLPRKLCDMEPEAIGAISVQFGTNPPEAQFVGKKFWVTFDKIITPRYYEDTDRLYNYDYDIRQVLADQQVKMLGNLQDSKFINAVEAGIRACNGSGPNNAGALGPMGDGRSAIRTYASFSGGLTRENLVDATSMMQDTPAHLAPSIVLLNSKTHKEVYKWGRDEMGGDFAEDILRQGWSDVPLMGLKWIVTIKSEIIPHGRMFMFAEPKYLGKHYVLHDLTLSVKTEDTMVSWYYYMSEGIGLANLAAFAAVDLNPRGISDNMVYTTGL